MVLGACAGAAVTLRVWRDRVLPPYADAWSRWRDGGVRAPLWGVGILWWGRAGKVLEFLAGLAVVLDLVKTESLRRLGRRASRAWQRYGTYLRPYRIIRVWRLAKAIQETLFDTHHESFRGAAYSWSSLRLSPQPLDPRPPFLAEDDLAAFQQELLRHARSQPGDTPRVVWNASHLMALGVVDYLVFAILARRPQGRCPGAVRGRLPLRPAGLVKAAGGVRGVV